ncbi:MAG: bifunctional UDP-N-acetylglucosamine diphosphorylase/glucosamine-1-phosphate N-acetyltransferase GlmU [Polyangiaceae bacterium]|nr:bifunctional UDP-N-acetylglucosamine diphosphorylase/glucosamine-1-phosphate N-acetyltransferase GlmU [Polyangiaceae bacterium]
MNSPRITAVVLAAGQGTRMKSPLPKVLHALAGRPMIHYVIDAALAAGAADVVVVTGHGRDQVEAYLAKTFGERVRTAVQAEQRGTGHATQIALEKVAPEADLLLLLCGDTPLLDGGELASLVKLLAENPDAPLAMLTMRPADATGYGRILRDENGRIVGIREHKDASAAERAITETNPGVYTARAAFLRDALTKIQPNNAQRELYLTDVVALAAPAGGVVSQLVRDPMNVAGINDRAQLAEAEDVLYRRIADVHRRGGATIRTSAKIDAGVIVEADSTIEHGVVLRGATSIGVGAVIDVGCVLTDVRVAASALVKPYSVASSSTIGEKAQIGPFSHLRPDSDVGPDAHVGNFVETKKTRLGRGAKANHLAYLGDGDVGAGANIGAGTIFCNYDGFQKHKTTIGEGAFIGSDSQIVAPVKIGNGAYVATGTTVTRDVPDDALAIARLKQENKEGYAARLKSRLKAAAKK